MTEPARRCTGASRGHRAPSGRIPRAARPGTKAPDAFTLVELLVVIAIIAILMALLMPALSHVRDSARAVQCASHVRQLALGMQFYVRDHDGALPWAWNAGADATDYDGIYGAAGWATQVYPYLDEPGVYACPSYGGPHNVRRLTTGSGATYMYTVHYRPNPNIGYDRGWYGPGNPTPAHMIGSIGHTNNVRTAWRHRPARLSSIRNVGAKVMLFDTKETDWMPYIPTPETGRRGFTNARGDGDRTHRDNYSPWWIKPSIGAWHSGRSNFAFFDGHLERLDAADERSFGTDSTGMAEEEKYWSLAH